jgi:4-alpha-glucanotransferase/(1->4)-alpha-D-glucan 1-alpha-D-glucosylmutase
MFTNQAFTNTTSPNVTSSHISLESGELRLIVDLDSGAFSIHYYAHHFPLDPGTYPRILGYHLDQLEARLDLGNPHLLEYQSLITAFNHLPPRTVKAPEKLTERNRDKAIYSGSHPITM